MGSRDGDEGGDNPDGGTRVVRLRRQIGLELFRAYRHNNAKLHPLRSLFWECTLRCNMHCRHCGSDCKVSSTIPDMQAADFLRAVDRLALYVDPHTTFVIFTGGEPLLRSDVATVGLELYHRGFPWGVVTNGLLLTEERLEELRRAGIHSVAVSLDGLMEDHNWVRQHKESFSGAERAIRLLSECDDVLWDVVTCVNPRNYATLPKIKDCLVAMGVRRWRIFTIFPMGRAASDPELQLTDAQFRDTLNFIKDCRVAHESTPTQQPLSVSYACEGFLGDYERRVRDQFFYCRAGVEVMSILCDGGISGCTSIRGNFVQGNIYDDDIWDVWQNRFQKFRCREWTRKGACKSCKVWRYCEGSGMHLYDNEENLLTCHYRRCR